MTLTGKWRITDMPDFDAGDRNMMEPAYILFEGNGSGEFAFGCVTGQIWGAGDAKARATDFSWDGNDEMDEACGHGWAELQPNDSIEGEISFHSGDEYEFAAVRWISSTAC